MSIDMNKSGDATATAPVPLSQQTYVMPRVNLLPPEIGEAEAFKRTRLILAGAVVGVVALLGVGYGLASWDAARAADELAAEQATTQRLTTEKGKYAQVTEVKNKTDAVRKARTTAMATDVLWAQQVDQIVGEMPADMTFTSMSIAFDPASASASAATNPLANPTVLGTISVEALGNNHDTAVAWVEAEGQHKGFTDVHLSASTVADLNGQVKTSFSTTMRFTPQLLSGRYEANGTKTLETGKVD